MKINSKFLVAAVCFVLGFAALLLSYKSSVAITTLADAQENKSRYPTIIIDAGHGGEDGGAQSASGLLEKNINLEIALHLKCLLEVSGFDVVMIREEDRQIYDDTAETLREKKVSDLHNRTKICNNTNNSIYISVHQNNFTESKYSGAQVFYSGTREESKILSEYIRASIVSLLQPDNSRSVKKATEEIYILYHAENPCVLVECGFLSNIEESNLLGTDKYRKEMAFSIYIGIVDYCYNNY